MSLYSWLGLAWLGLLRVSEGRGSRVNVCHVSPVYVSYYVPHMHVSNHPTTTTATDRHQQQQQPRTSCPPPPSSPKPTAKEPASTRPFLASPKMPRHPSFVRPITSSASHLIPTSYRPNSPMTRGNWLK